MSKSSYHLSYNWNCETITELLFFCHMWCTSSCSIYITRVCHQQNIYISSLYIICFLAFVSHNKVFALLLPFSVFLMRAKKYHPESYYSLIFICVIGYICSNVFGSWQWYICFYSFCVLSFYFKYMQQKKKGLKVVRLTNNFHVTIF